MLENAMRPPRGTRTRATPLDLATSDSLGSNIVLRPEALPAVLPVAEAASPAPLAPAADEAAARNDFWRPRSRSQRRPRSP